MTSHTDNAALDAYDAGHLNDFGGGNVEWWQDYIRAELGRAHEFYQSQVDSMIVSPAPAEAPELTDEQIIDKMERAGFIHVHVLDAVNKHFVGTVTDVRALLRRQPSKEQPKLTHDEALQELVDIAQENDMGYGTQPVAGQPAPVAAVSADVLKDKDRLDWLIEAGFQVWETRDQYFIHRAFDHYPISDGYMTAREAIDAFMLKMPMSPPTSNPSGCRSPIVDDWWNFCGETDMGQTAPVLCTACGGTFARKPTENKP
jgi:hypothetical protein